MSSANKGNYRRVKNTSPSLKLSSLFLQQIMKDRWINTGFEEDELKPYTEPELDITDQKRIGTNTAKQAAAELTAPFFHLFTLSLMPAEPVISCFVREKRAKASKPSAPFVEVRTGLCRFLPRASQRSQSDYFSSADLLKKR